MAKPTASRKKVRKPAKAARKRRAAPAKRRARTSSPLFAPIEGATRTELAGVRLEAGRAGAARVKRVIYPAGFRWSVDMKPTVGGDLCMHAHVGFLASGAIRIEYPDGCAFTYAAPRIVAIEPGHDGSVVGREPAVLIELDFEGETVRRLGMPDAHGHA
jgi:hypothetical protein